MYRAAAALLIGLALGCGKAAPPDTSPIAATGVVGGRVLLPGGADGVSPRLTVSIVGAPISAAVGSLGDFALPNVPAGPLALHFSGAGLAAGVDAGTIAGGETVTIGVRIEGNAARIESIARVRGDDALVEGLIETPPVPLPPNTILVGGRTVILGGTREPASRALAPGMRVRVTGTLSAAGIIARDVIIR